MTITYDIYVATTPEKLWDALTSSDVLAKNWGKIESPWTAGAKVKEVDDSGKVLWQGSITRSEPPRLLSYTFDVIGTGETPTEILLEIGRAASPVANGASVARLRLTQSGFDVNSKVYEGCARAWPEILSSIKSYVETGRPLGFAWKH
jgi:uncharacterized protein YndB with AHSA1/START domain